MEINRRKFHRIPGSMDPCILNVDNVQLHGAIADESINGAKVVDLDLMMLPRNKPLTLEYRKGHFDVRARYLYRGKNGKFSLGLVRTEELTTEQLTESSAMLLNCYLQYEQAHVICMPIHIESETVALIQLWDGVQFRVPISQLKPLTRRERYHMLADPERLAYTRALYGFQDETESEQNRIFEFEFGTWASCPILNPRMPATT